MELTFDRAVDILDELVAEKGASYVYTRDPKTMETKDFRADRNPSINGCYYGHLDGTPGCIVGHVVHKLNPEFDLTQNDRLLMVDFVDSAGIEMDHKVSALLASVQYDQDRSWSWGEAVKRAKVNAGMANA